MGEPPRWVVGLYRRIAGAAPRRVRHRTVDEQVRLLLDVWRDERPASWLVVPFWLALLLIRAGLAAIAMYRDERLRSATISRGRLGGLARDVRQAVRSIRRSPWSSATLVGVIAAGVALAATVFALIDGVLFKALPYRTPAELYAITGRAGGEDIGRSSVSISEVAAWRTAVPDVRFTTHSTSVGYGTLDIVNGPTVWARGVDRDFFDTVGVRPMLGGFELADYDAQQATRPVIITFALWQRVFGGDPEVVGRILTIGRASLRIAGVMPNGFVFPSPAGQGRPDMIWPDVSPAPHTEGWSSRTREVIARVPASVSLPALDARLKAALPSSPELAGQPPAFDQVVITPLKNVLTARERTGAWLAFAACAAMVLLVAVNVGGLVSGRSLDRRQESAVRRALGAGSLDLLKLQFLEVALLVAIAGAAGTLLARFLLIETANRLPADILLLREPAIDSRVIAAVVLAGALVAAVATLAGIRASRVDALALLLGRGAGAVAGPARRFGRNLLQTIQIALAILLVIGGALFLTSLRNVWRADTGYDLSDVMYIDVRVGAVPGSATALVRTLELLDRLRAVPRVSSAAVIDTWLLGGARRGSTLRPPLGAPDEAELIPVSSRFFALAGLRAIEGRLPTDAELDAGAPVAVVSARVAREYWPDRSAVGQVLTGRRGALSVIGVVKDSRFQRLDQPSYGEIYAPLQLGLFTTPAPTFLISGSLPEETLMPQLLEVIRRFEPSANIRRAQPVSLALAESIRRRRFHGWLFGGLAACSLIVAATGIFGLVASATARRTREMGLRLALGSTPAGLSKLLLREQLAPVAIGIVAGGIAAAIGVRFVRSFLYEVSAYDYRVWLTAAAAVLAAAALGALVPASRVSRTDPVAALKAD